MNRNTEPKSNVIWIIPYTKHDKINYAKDLSVTAILL